LENTQLHPSQQDSRNYDANPSQFAGLIAFLFALLVCLLGCVEQ
jgi:hypothetical protein